MRNLRRLGCLLLVLLLLVLLLACGNAAESGTDTPVPAPETPARTEPPAEEVVLSVTETPVLTLPPTPTPSPTPTPTPTPTPSPTPVPTPFGILWLPDTQGLAYYHPDKLEALGNEIAARREPDRLVAVIHTGDIVDNGYKDWQWDNFDLCLSAFSDVLPFYPIAGNHDLGVNLLKYNAYLKRPFLEKLPQDQIYGGGKMYYILLHEGGMELLLLGVGWDCGKTTEELAWIDSVLSAYPDTPCILFTHKYLKANGDIYPDVAKLTETAVKKYPNVRLILCGHARMSAKNVQSYDDDGDGVTDREVTALMLNRQTSSFAYRVLTIDPLTRSIEIRTYLIGNSEPLEKDDNGPLNFTLENMF